MDSAGGALIMPRTSPTELAYRMGTRTRRADALTPISVGNEIEEVENLYRAGALSEREFYLRLRRLGLDYRAANERRRGMRI
jgi:hypothetical protein